MVSIHVQSAIAAVAGMAGIASADVVSFTQVFRNTTTATKAYEYSMTVPITGSFDASLMSGIVTASLVDLNGNGAFVRTVGDSALYTAFVDDTAVQTLWNPGWSFSVGNYLGGDAAPARFDDMPVIVATEADGIMKVTIRFELSARDMVTIGANFQLTQVPAPGAVALLAIAGFASRRRRG